MIQSYIKNLYPGDQPKRVAWSQGLVQACTSFVESRLADPKFINELVSGDETKFWSCISEALVAHRLGDKPWPERPNLGVGPDFLVMDGERKVWIEVVCPAPVQLVGKKSADNHKP